MVQPVSSSFPLSDLVLMLRAKGFVLSVEQVLHLQNLLLGEDLRHRKAAGLKYLVAPLVAENAAEQAQVYALVDAFVAARQKGRTMDAAPARNPWWKDRKKLFRAKVAGLALVLLTGLFLFLRQELNAPSAAKPVLPAPRSEAPADPGGEPGRKGQEGPRIREEEAALRFDTSVRRIGALQAVPINHNLQISGIFGILLGIVLYIVLFDVGKKAFVRVPDKKVQRNEPLGTLAHTDGRNEEGAEVLAEQPEDTGVRFPDQGHLLGHSAEWTTLRKILLRAEVLGPERLDIPRTIRATTGRAGLVQLAYAAKSYPVRYLLLIDESDPARILPQLFHQLAGFLVDGRLPAKRYRLRGADGTWYDDAGRAQRADTILAEEPDAWVFYFGDGRLLAPAAPGKVVPWQTLLAQMASKTLVTPVLPADWSAVELQLRTEGWQLLPADDAALVHFARSLSAGKPVSIGAWRQLLPGTVAGDRLYTVDGLRQYLGQEGLFQFVCCLALFPRLDWNLALALYDAFATNGPLLLESKATYAVLLQLGRIPWMRAGRLQPEWRLMLLQALRPDCERWGRETILRLLETIAQRDPGQELGEEYRVQTGLNAFFLYSHDSGRYARYKESRHLFPTLWQDIDEWELKVRLHDDRSGLLPVALGGAARTVDEYILKEKEFETRNLTLSKASVLLLPAFLAYILFSLLRPYAIYPDDVFEKVTVKAVVVPDVGCAAATDAELVPPFALQGTPLRKLSARDTFRFAGREYGERMEFILRSSSGRWTYVPFTATDSLVVIRVGCHVRK